MGEVKGKEMEKMLAFEYCPTGRSIFVSRVLTTDGRDAQFEPYMGLILSKAGLKSLTM